MSDEVPTGTMFANELPPIGERKASTTPFNGDLPKFTGTKPATPRAERTTGLRRFDGKLSRGTAVERHSPESQATKRLASLQALGLLVPAPGFELGTY
jgi:hypothetical protein